jgi:hypothetical protein
VKSDKKINLKIEKFRNLEIEVRAARAVMLGPAMSW